MKLGFWRGLGKPFSLKVGAGGGVSAQYWQKVVAMSPITYLPLWDAAGSSSAIDLMGLGNGTPSNVTFGLSGAGDGRTAASFNGSNSKVNIFSSALASAFDGARGTLSAWAKVSGSGIWTDGTIRYITFLIADGNNNVYLARTSTNNVVRGEHAGSSAFVGVNVPTTTTDWFHLAVTWNKTNNAVKVYFNGSQSGATQAGVGTFSGSLTAANIGATAAPANSWSGLIAHVALWASELDSSQISALASIQ